mmetsp:Transcript_33681/g.33945  ORF Transcript_33681/g.33945 Transcript_33681/m.33945 type:complete len:117 (-) Transcript_33681:123-473(-)
MIRLFFLEKIDTVKLDLLVTRQKRGYVTTFIRRNTNPVWGVPWRGGGCYSLDNGTKTVPVRVHTSFPIEPCEGLVGSYPEEKRVLVRVSNLGGRYGTRRVSAVQVFRRTLTSPPLP